MNTLDALPHSEQQHYDRLNLGAIGALVLACAAFASFDAARRPPSPLPADPPVAAASSLAISPTRTPDAAPVSAPLTLAAAQGWLRLSGAVADDHTRRALVAAATEVVGADRVVADQLVVTRQAPVLPWLARAAEVMTALNTSSSPAGVQLDGDRVTLTGEVSQEFHRVAREAQARDWFGRGLAVENRVTVTSSVLPAAAPAAVAVAAPTGACATLADGVPLAFTPGQATLTAAGREQLQALVPCLGSSGRWRVAGHTDANGIEAKNVELTRARASSVREALIAAGVSADRLEATGLGSSRPLADNASRDGRLRNRRISFDALP